MVNLSIHNVSDFFGKRSCNRFEISFLWRALSLQGSFDDSFFELCNQSQSMMMCHS